METSLKTGFAQIFSYCLKTLSYSNFGGAAAPSLPPPPGPYAYVLKQTESHGSNSIQFNSIFIHTLIKYLHYI